MTVVSDDTDPPCDRTFCSKQYLIGMKSPDETLIADLQMYDQAKGGARLRLACKVQALDIDGKFVILPSGERMALAYDVLVLAMGAEPKRPPVPGFDRPNVHVLRSLRDADDSYAPQRWRSAWSLSVQASSVWKWPPH